MASIGSKIRVVTDWLLAEGMTIYLMENKGVVRMDWNFEEGCNVR